MKTIRHEGGFALIAVIFILVMLAGAGSAMLKISAGHQATASMALLGARAYHAARSGVEWAVYEAVNGTGCPAAGFALNEGAAAGFDVDVTCSTTTHVEGSTGRATLQIRSTAEYGNFGDRDYVSRTLNATVVQ